VVNAKEAGQYRYEVPRAFTGTGVVPGRRISAQRNSH